MRGGPRTQHKHNQFPIMKVGLRKWLLRQFGNDEKISVLDVYGGYGLMYRRVWKDYKYEAIGGDAVSGLKARAKLNYNVFDVDPYSSPYEALYEVNKKSVKNKITIVCTDGCLRRQAQFRGNIPKFLQEVCGWSRKDNALMAGIYYQYPKFLRYVLSRVLCSFDLEKLVCKYGRGSGSSSTVYFAGVLFRKK